MLQKKKIYNKKNDKSVENKKVTASEFYNNSIVCGISKIGNGKSFSILDITETIHSLKFTRLNCISKRRHNFNCN